MFPNTLPQFFNDWTFLVVSSGLSKVILSILVLFFGFFVARRLTTFLRHSGKKVLSQEIVQDSPLAVLFESTQALKGSGFFTAVIYWSIVFLFLSIAGEILGITFFSHIVSMIVGYIPTLLSALLVFMLGIVVSGIMEKVVKQQFKRLAPQQSVLAGTLASYITLALFVMIALSELGIASDFILILFAGFVFATALTIGIAFGFGAKELVAETLSSMVHEEKKQRTQSKAK